MSYEYDIEGSTRAQRTRQNAEGMVKTWEDLARYRAVIALARPDVIVEAGTFNGHSACWFAHEAGCPVITIDTVDQVDDETKTRAVQERVTFVHGSSTAGDVVFYVHDRCAKAERVLVVLDSDHSGPHVLCEMEAYADLVPVGGFMVVEDTIVRFCPWEHPYYTGSPMDAVDDWLAAHRDSWIVDSTIDEMHPTGQHPRGWLRRVR